MQRINFRNLGWVAGGFLVVGLIASDCRSANVGPVAASGEPLPVTVVATPQPTATPAPLPQPTGTPQRVNFDKGSYGATLTGSGANRYVLWAAAGQVFKLAMAGDGQTSLYGTDGRPLWADVQAGQLVTATLVGNGDQLLEIRSRGAFTVGVEIR